MVGAIAGPRALSRPAVALRQRRRRGGAGCAAVREAAPDHEVVEARGEVMAVYRAREAALAWYTNGHPTQNLSCAVNDPPSAFTKQGRVQ